MKVTARLVTGMAVVLYLAPLLLNAPLTDPDEGLHAAIAQEMIEHGDVVVPRFLGHAFLDKPILFFWAQRASLSAFGMNSAAARLPGLLFALLAIATTGWLARVLFDPAGDWVAATCYATMALPFLLAQAPVHDMALVPFTNVALGCLWRAQRRWDSGFGIWDLGCAGVALGLAALAKGLEGVVLVGVAYGLYLLIARAVSWRVVGQGMAVLAIAAAIAAPWYLAMESREPGYLRYYFIDRHLLGFATDTQRHGGQPWWFYVPIVLGGGLPWILYLGRIADLTRLRSSSFVGQEGPRRKGTGPQLLLWTWFAGAVVVLSLSGSKAVTYVLPAMPAVAVLAARAWVSALASDTLDEGSQLRAARLWHAAIFFVVAGLTPWAASRFAAQPVTTAEVVGFLAAAATWAWLMITVPRRPASHAWPRLALATGGTYALAFALLGPPIAQAHSARDLATYFNRSARLPSKIFVMDERVSFVFYLRPELRRELRPDQIRSVSVEELAAMRPFPPDALVALPADLAGRLSRVPQLKEASRQIAGRYVVVSP